MTRTREWVLAAATATVMLLAGCGSSAQLPGTGGGGSSTTHSTSADPANSQGAAPQKAPTHKFTFQVNVVCRTVRQGAPAQLRAPYTAAKVTHYGSESEPVARRTRLSLQRLLVLGGGHAGELPALIAGYEQLTGTYTAAAALARTQSQARRLAAAIQQHEEAVTATARAGGFLACGVSGG